MYDYKPVSVPDDVLMAARSGQETVARLAAQSNARNRLVVCEGHAAHDFVVKL
jgi:hypothetical protein